MRRDSSPAHNSSLGGFLLLRGKLKTYYYYCYYSYFYYYYYYYDFC